MRYRRFPGKWLGRPRETLSTSRRVKRFCRRGVADPYDFGFIPEIALHERNPTMKELARSAPVRTAPLGSSDLFKTQAERLGGIAPDASQALD